MNLMVYNGQNIHLLMRLMCAVISGVHTNLLQNIFIFVSIKLGFENIDAYSASIRYCPRQHSGESIL